MSTAVSESLESLMAVLNASPEQRFAMLSSRDDPERALLELMEQATRLTMVNADRAVDAAAMLVTLADAFSFPLPRARARRVQVRALSYAGRYGEALIVGERGVYIAEQSGLAEEAGRIQLATMHALTEAGRLQDAITAGEQARAAFTSAQNAELAAKAEINLGIVHQRCDAPAEAVACFDRAQAELTHDPLTLGHLENSRGEALLALHDFAAAEHAFARALQAFEIADAELTAAIAQGNLAELAMRRGRFDEAMILFEKARRRFESAASPGHLARLIAEQAEAKAMIGMFEDALRDYRHALQQLDACNLPLEACRARSGMGCALLQLGQLSEAETALAAAATGFSELGHQTAQARVDLNRAELMARSGRLVKARSLALRALSVLETRPVDAIAVRHLLARLAMEQGNLELANSELNAAMSGARKYALRPLLADLQVTRGQLQRRLGQMDEAMHSWRAAIDDIEHVRSTLQVARFRTAFLGERTIAYEQLVAALIARRGPEDLKEAFAVAERCKCRSLSEAIDSSAGSATAQSAHEDAIRSPSSQATDDGTVTELLARSEQIRTDLNALYSRLADHGVSALSPQAYEHLLQTVTQSEHALQDIDVRITSITGKSLTTMVTADVEEIRAALQSDDALIQYFAIDDRFIAFVITESGVEVEQLGSVRAVEMLVRRTMFQMDRALRPGAMRGDRVTRLLADVQRELHALYLEILGPLQPHIGDARRLHIVPHGALHGVSFAALFDGQSYLIDRCTIRSSPNATLACQPSNPLQSHAKTPRALVVGVGDLDATQIDVEARAVQEHLTGWDTTVLLDSQATCDQVRALISGADLVHFACHGEFAESSPFSSGLKLFDRWLTSRDVADSRMKASLVVLSACESGRSAIQGGDEISGLLRSFLASGSSAVLASHWRVHDASSRLFMKQLYEHCQADGWRSSSLESIVRRAMLNLRKQYPHPAFWAVYQLTGGVR